MIIELKKLLLYIFTSLIIKNVNSLSDLPDTSLNMIPENENDDMSELSDLINSLKRRSSQLVNIGQTTLDQQTINNKIILPAEMNNTEKTSEKNKLVLQVENINEKLLKEINILNKLERAQSMELNRTSHLIKRAEMQYENNHRSRQACIIQYNKNSVQLNSLLSDMITGADQVNRDVLIANKIKRRMELDISKFNTRIHGLDEWLGNMDKWTKFILSETDELDRAQARLLKWGDNTKDILNMHEIAGLKIGRELFNLETYVISLHDQMLSAASLIGYVPSTLSVPEASGGTGWAFTPWG